MRVMLTNYSAATALSETQRKREVRLSLTTLFFAKRLAAAMASVGHAAEAV